ncbi:xyloglucan-specific galacturonosyltransferase 1-like [Zingiber officinale]|uniref:xyloglucan-specific galacturonosyltransferase 1-like n=1 Tax=Zingiber officinale TaxID=94328 RepID=UPI001C4B1ECA|nr:xyloglucan-specific galacturonosyltransferase 1-like [Zingiber officinale]
MEIPVDSKSSPTSPKLLRRVSKQQPVTSHRFSPPENSKRCLQVPTFIICLICLNIWCAFLFIHSFHFCISSPKVDLYCISISTGKHPKLSTAIGPAVPDGAAGGEPEQNWLEKEKLVDLEQAPKGPESAQENMKNLSESPEVERTQESVELANRIEAQAPGMDRNQEPVEMGVREESNRLEGQWGTVAVQSYMSQLRTLAAKGAHVTGERGSCDGRGVYVYDLPSKFNRDLAAMCGDLLPWADLCKYFANEALGEKAEALGPRWYGSHQYFLEPIFHNRIQNHPCRVHDRDAARLFYVPFYGGLDVVRWHFRNVSTEVKDALGVELIRWLEEQPSWRRNSGSDHIFVLGKISWDFRRYDNRHWGSNFLLLDQMQKSFKFLIERQPWERNDVGVPHPTHFHPHDDADITAWQLRLSAFPRRNLVGFAGAAREEESIRSALIEQCIAATPECRFLNCNDGGCMKTEVVVGLFMESEFCLQPPGDSPTRKSVFDSLVAGCIPVIFNPFTAYYQYPWHLPEDHQRWSVFIEEEEVRQGKVDVVERLRRVPAEEREEMRRYIVHQIMPGLVYGDATARFERFRDAFDIVVDNVMEKLVGGSAGE